MDTGELLLILVSWAAHLTSYEYPGTAPELEYRPRAFFVEHVCGGDDRCRVAAWYNDDGTVYLDDRVTDIEDAMVRSVLVHEMVHYLQDISGKFGTSCEERQKREREAYAIQRIYINRIAGRFAATWPVRIPCPEGADRTTP